MTARPLVIYHGSCPDGFTAAWCFWRKYGDGADYYPGVYQQAPPDVEGRDVYLVDFSYKRDVVLGMLESARSVTLVDHHKSALEDLAGMPVRANFDSHTSLDKSGARLAWEYLFGDDQPPQLLLHVEDRDLWRFSMPRTKEMTAYLLSHEYNFDTWTSLMSADTVTSLTMMAVQGEAIVRKHTKDVRELVAALTRRMMIGGYNVPVLNVPYTHGSEACEIIAVGEPFAGYYYDKPHGREFGLRSAPDGLDVSIVAIEYGGGGHKHASGFRVSRNHPLACS